MIPTVALAIVMGIVPGFFMRPMGPSVDRIIERVTGQQPAQVRSSSTSSSSTAERRTPGTGLQLPVERRVQSPVR